MRTKNLTFKLTLASVLCAFAIISFVLESLFPPLFIPGARMGLSNIFILLTVILIGNVYGYAVLIIKITLGSLFAGNISSALYSLPAGVISLSVEILLLCFTTKVSVIAVSIAGACFNTTVQNLVFCLVAGSPEYLCYLPYLACIGVLAGLIVGFAVYLVVKFLPKNFIDKLY